MLDHHDPVWALVEAGNFAGALELHQKAPCWNEDWRNLSREAELLNFLGRHQEALEAVQKADALVSEAVPGLRLTEAVGVSQWLAGNIRSALETFVLGIDGILSGRIEYTDGIKGGGIGLLALTAARALSDSGVVSKAEAFLASRLVVPNTKPWPIPVIEFVLGRSNRKDLLNSTRRRIAGFLPLPSRRIDLLHRAEAWFYLGIKDMLAGHEKRAASYFGKCVNTTAPAGQEWLLARALLSESGLAGFPVPKAREPRQS